MDRRKSIQLAPEEIRRFMDEGRTAMLATNGRDGYPHLIAMWYAVKDGDLVMTTYGKSQKAVNIRRDPRATMMWEAGTSYNKLAGLMIRGRAEIVDDPVASVDACPVVEMVATVSFADAHVTTVVRF